MGDGSAISRTNFHNITFFKIACARGDTSCEQAFALLLQRSGCPSINRQATVGMVLNSDPALVGFDRFTAWGKISADTFAGEELVK